MNVRAVLRQFIATFFVFSSSTTVFGGHGAKIVQILHTNDIHSHWVHSEFKDRGGIARIKALLDKLEAEGDKKGWITVRLDAGDFSEGHINFFAHQGADSFQLTKLMNFDVVALGNHDYLTGVNDLIAHASREAERLPLVASNFHSNLPTGVLPGRIIDRSGLRIAVVGATTNDIYYTWAADPAKISSPAPDVEAWLSTQKDANLHVALTHLGVQADVGLAATTFSIDVIIGGHSHTVLKKPLLTINRRGEVVPIVQAGALGNYLGQTVMEVFPNERPRLKSYKLYPITPDLPEDAQVAQAVQESRSVVQQYFNVDLNEDVAESKDNFDASTVHFPVLGNFLADVLREVAQADIALDFGQLYGLGLTKGPITVEDALMLQPHIYDWRNEGWHVYRTRVRGCDLKIAMQIAVLQPTSVYVSGLDVQISSINIIKRIRVNGAPVEDSRVYTLALSEGFLTGAANQAVMRHLIHPPYEDTGHIYRNEIFVAVLKQKVFASATFGPPRIYTVKEREDVAVPEALAR